MQIYPSSACSIDKWIFCSIDEWINRAEEVQIISLHCLIITTMQVRYWERKLVIISIRQINGTYNFLLIMIWENTIEFGMQSIVTVYML